MSLLGAGGPDKKSLITYDIQHEAMFIHRQTEGAKVQNTASNSATWHGFLVTEVPQVASED